MKASVIVPVYNAAAYLGDCLDSLLEQGFGPGDYEILCVDDGSTDGSGEIAEEYARLHLQIRVLHQENRGAGCARNAGLDAASGEYLYFADADDLLGRGVLAPLCEMAGAMGLDSLFFDCVPFPEGTPPPALEGNPLEKPVIFPDGMGMAESGRLPEWRMMGIFIVRRAVVEAYGLRFFPGLLFEDQEFHFWLDHCVGRCGCTGQRLYGYRRRSGSTLGTFREESRFPAYIHGRIRLAEWYARLLEACRRGSPPHTLRPIGPAELERRMIGELQGALNYLILQRDPALLERFLGEMKAAGLYPYPMRWGRLLRRTGLRKKGIDLAAFLLPWEGYLRFCAWACRRLRRS